MVKDGDKTQNNVLNVVVLHWAKCARFNSNIAQDVDIGLIGNLTLIKKDCYEYTRH
jgi:hypothetical protein